MKKRICGRLEKLENRLMLAVDAFVSRGDLIVAGTPDGEITIEAVTVASEEGDAIAYKVTDGDTVIAETLTGVKDDILICLRGDSKTVNIDLKEATVDQLYASLGMGTNVLNLKGGTIDRSLDYRGASGEDSVTIENAAIGGRLRIELGRGDNELTLSNAQIEGHLNVTAGSGADDVTINAWAMGMVDVSLGSGANSLLVDDATIDGDLGYSGGDGNDTVTIGKGGTVLGSVLARLGGAVAATDTQEAGANAVRVEGAIDTDLVVRSDNEGDTVTLVVDEQGTAEVITVTKETQTLQRTPPVTGEITVGRTWRPTRGDRRCGGGPGAGWTGKSFAPGRGFMGGGGPGFGRMGW